LSVTYCKYERYLRHIHITNKTQKYRIFAMITFLGVELFLTKFLKIEFAKGYAQSQIQAMNTYDMLLIQLGEKYHSDSTQSWPVEWQLLLLAGINVLTFMAVKFIANYMGDGITAPLTGMINAVLTGATSTTAPPPLTSGVAPEPTAIPEVPGGNNMMNTVGNLLQNLDIGAILGQLGGMMGGGAATAGAPARPAPARNETVNNDHSSLWDQ